MWLKIRQYLFGKLALLLALYLALLPSLVQLTLTSEVLSLQDIKKKESYPVTFLFIQKVKVSSTCRSQLTLNSALHTNPVPNLKTTALEVHSGIIPCRTFEHLRYKRAYSGQPSFSTLHKNTTSLRIHFLCRKMYVFNIIDYVV